VFVRAANEGRTVIERYPKEKVAEDFLSLADKILAPMTHAAAAEKAVAAASRSGFKLFGRAAKEQPVRA
jgi:Flp pilus assembly CpaE family ATPase